jgi:lipoyl-dependent peroxiredoxin
LFTGKTHTTAGANGSGRSADGFLDIKLPQPHPAAEDLFGVAWSACYMGAIELAASRKKVTLPPGLAVDAQIDLHLDGMEFSLTARLDVTMPGVDREVATELIHDAHGICPYSKATRGNITVETNLVDAKVGATGAA